MSKLMYYGETKPTYYGDLAGQSYGTDNDRPPLVLLHGLTYDRRQWRSLLEELRRIDPERRVLTLDLPGHGESPRLDSYAADDVATVIRQAVVAAGLDNPVLVGHSLGGVLATAYAGSHPVRAVVNLDQPLIVTDFGIYLREVETQLRGPSYLEVWEGLLTAMRIDLLPESMRYLVRSATTPRQDLLLGYWNEVLVSSAGELQERWTNILERLRANDTYYCHVSGAEVSPAYRTWLTSILPEATITRLSTSGHFVHLGRPAELARLLAAC
jgi:pimeloyl-ACP methyl ester carboxylesterase